MAIAQMVLISEWLAYHVWIVCPDWPKVDLDDALLEINVYTHLKSGIITTNGHNQALEKGKAC